MATVSNMISSQTSHSSQATSASQIGRSSGERGGPQSFNGSLEPNNAMATNSELRSMMLEYSAYAVEAFCLSGVVYTNVNPSVFCLFSFLLGIIKLIAMLFLGIRRYKMSFLQELLTITAKVLLTLRWAGGLLYWTPALTLFAFAFNLKYITEMIDFSNGTFKKSPKRLLPVVLWTVILIQTTFLGLNLDGEIPLTWAITFIPYFGLAFLSIFFTIGATVYTLTARTETEAEGRQNLMVVFWFTYAVIAVNSIVLGCYFANDLEAPHMDNSVLSTGFAAFGGFLLSFAILTYVFQNMLKQRIAQRLAIVPPKSKVIFDLEETQHGLSFQLLKMSPTFFALTRPGDDSPKRTTLETEAQSPLKETKKPEAKGLTADNLENCSNDSCMLCEGDKSTIVLVPCGHSGFCVKCAKDLCRTETPCPLCRKKIEKFLVISDQLQNAKGDLKNPHVVVKVMKPVAKPQAM